MNDIGNPSRKSYDEGCIAAHALDIVGDRWALLVAREMMLGPKRFGALRAGLPGISANILTQRLADLEGMGLVVRQVLPPPAQVQVYALTPAGLALRPVLEALCRWGAAMPGHDPRLFISPTALMMSMAAMIDAGNGQGQGIVAEFRIGAEVFAARVDQGRLQVARDAAPEAVLRFAGGTNALARVIYGREPLAQSVAVTGVSFEGDPILGQAFVDLFSLRR